MRMTLTVLLAVVAGTASAQVYQCPGPGGQKVFQQSPCAGGKELDVKPVQQVGGTMLGGQAAPGAGDVDRRLAILQAAARGEPAVGMTSDQLDRAMGAPHKVHVANYGGGPEEQRVYRRDGRTYYVYTRDGQVSGIQNQDTGRRKPACPSSRELREAETDASAVTPSYEERQRRAQRLADLKQQDRDCR